jgi:hypothetical protein
MVYHGAAAAAAARNRAQGCTLKHDGSELAVFTKREYRQLHAPICATGTADEEGVERYDEGGGGTSSSRQQRQTQQAAKGKAAAAAAAAGSRRGANSSSKGQRQRRGDRVVSRR